MPTRARLIALLAALAAGVPASAAAQDPAGQPTGGAQAIDTSRPALIATPGQLLGRTVRVGGLVPGADAGRQVAIERQDPLTQIWEQVALATVDADHTFRATWRADRLGRVRLRATLVRLSPAAASEAPAEVAVTVFRPARATWYGPRFFGRRTACGVRLTKSLLGVAHKRLPCGTLVQLHYEGRSVTVPVVDRGPFRRGVSWDLTAATADALGFTVTDRVGALILG